MSVSFAKSVSVIAMSLVLAAPMSLGSDPKVATDDAGDLILAQAEPSAPAATPEVDESALRYFARQGDTRRLEIEIARLRALYPDWVPPTDLLSAPPQTDPELDAIWDLYSQGRLAEVRQKIAERQSADSGWSPPADLIDRLELAEARERLINASDLKQYDTVIKVASEKSELLTCSEVDVLWRVAEAFAQTNREQRSFDTYRYVLTNCENPNERLATIQNASKNLSRSHIDELLKLERKTAGIGEFEPFRDDLARAVVAEAGEDEKVVVPAEQLTRLEQLAEREKKASDALLLGWYYLRRENIDPAEKWFRQAFEAEQTASAARGIALVLIEREKFADAEGIMYRWRADDDDSRSVYLAAVANLLGTEPRPALSPDVLSRIVTEVAAAKDVIAANQLGWYARAWQQHETAKAWFNLALQWKSDDEEAAYGLGVSYFQLGQTAELAAMKQRWQGRSERIQLIGTEAQAPATTAPMVTPPQTATAAPQTAAPAPQTVQTAPDVRVRDTSAAPPRPSTSAPQVATRAPQTRSSSTSYRRGCSDFVHPETLAPEAALARGWCLMDLNRPLEAAQAFEVALRSRTDRVRSDASYGQSLAYLRAGLVNEAAVAATKARQEPSRTIELQTSILAERALGAFERGRYAEALLALDQRAQIAPERVDLMVLRGYAYMKLNRLGDASRALEAAAGTGNRDAIRALADLRNQLNGQ